MNQKGVLGVCVFALVVTSTALGLWYRENSQLQQVRAQVVAGELVPIAMLLKEDEAILKELRAEPSTEMASGILESYLAKIRRDGVPKHADMKQKLDALAENNTAIVTLIKVYAPQGKTAAFVDEGDKFRNYASAWRDRSNSVMELFMAGGNDAASGVPFPDTFASAVDAEIAAAK
jgi:nanoRNase/pAp phosphatase (c-di-AMP/oligoRNAs hydrolase)